MRETVVPELSVEELHGRLQSGETMTLLDVREPQEVALCSLPDAIHIPLGQLSARLPELPQNWPLVAYCHHGARSAQAVQLLLTHGHPNSSNLVGGIDAWARRIDSTMTLY